MRKWVVLFCLLILAVIFVLVLVGPPRPDFVAKYGSDRLNNDLPQALLDNLWLMVLFMAAPAIQAMIYYKQAELMKHSLAEMRRSVDAYLTRERGLIWVRVATLERVNEDYRDQSSALREIDAKFWFQNHGATPLLIGAYQTVLDISDDRIPKPISKEGATPHPEPVRAGGESNQLSSLRLRLTPNDIEQVSSGTRFLRFYGVVVHEDVFAIERTDHFAFVSSAGQHRWDWTRIPKFGR